jgi:hypothetical protein
MGGMQKELLVLQNFVSKNYIYKKTNIGMLA